MKCQLEPLLKILPPALREGMKQSYRDDLQEIRLRYGQQVEWVYQDGFCCTDLMLKDNDLKSIVNAASRYSPWAAETISQGYLTIEGGHRIGLCGEMIFHRPEIKGIRQIDSLCIRLARDLHGIAHACGKWTGSLLIIGAPGWGKSTMLRDQTRLAAQRYSTVVIDERSELFPKGFVRGQRMDVLTGCPKKEGIEIALRTMGPEIIAVDEITAREDSTILLQAANCGVRLIATAHAASLEDLRRRPAYRELLENRIFTYVLCLRKDKSMTMERMGE